MADRESTAVGYRLRMQPSDLSTYPDAAKLVWFDLVVKHGLTAKLRDLRRGKDKDGAVHPLAPRTIKYRKSEVGPVTKTAPRGIPALDLSRVISLLTGRAHTSSAEFWWGFDSVTGDSFAKILHFWAGDQGHDVFGLSPQGTAWTLAQATVDWEAWKASPAAQRLAAGRPGIPAARQVRKPVATVSVRQNLEDYDLFPGAKPIIEKAMAEGRFSGFRRLNARGEQWRPGQGLGPGPAAPPKPPRQPPPAPPKPKPKPVVPPVASPKPKPAAVPVSDAIDIRAEPRVARQARIVLDAIDRVHSDGNMARLPLKSAKIDDYEGFIHIGSESKKPMVIAINPEAATPHMTIAHETGHLIDYSAIPRVAPQIGDTGVQRNFRSEELFAEFIKAVDESESIKTLRSRIGQTKLAAEGGHYPIDREHVAYLLQDHEIWARAYSQWIAYRSGDDDLIADLQHRLKLNLQVVYRHQWQEADFYAIGRAIDGIFLKLGWLK